MAFTPADPTKAEVKVIQNGDQLAFDFYFPRGAKGDPGGITSPTQITSGYDFNNLVVSGLYWTLGSDYASFVNAPPLNIPGGVAMSIMVIARGATIVDQHVTLTNTSTIAKVRMERTQITGTWGPWRFTPSLAISEAVGRTIHAYDYLNNRSQLIYGDTGRRNISDMVTAGTTFTGGGKLTIRREGSMVDIYCVGWMPGAAGTVHLLASGLPTGFKPSNSRAWFAAQNGQPALCTMAFDATTLAIISNAATIHPIGFSFSYSTTDPWPSVLPGSADGSIPPV
ncbi:hypothetical protein SALGADO_29 [Arthrobacter phage Salgado]|uniref:Minor tail protein n=1 Tax=Arthrobacter phage Salgado TaxID=1772314 RepID=A0A0U4JDU7_9CAUD|nr:minor tail protein [Arthrobacter phage Salgado]ALY10197.1 hypothetical protein SALGADO_29 [Arthrobacter phage Salgado]